MVLQIQLVDNPGIFTDTTKVIIWSQKIALSLFNRNNLHLGKLLANNIVVICNGLYDKAIKVISSGVIILNMEYACI